MSSSKVQMLLQKAREIEESDSDKRSKKLGLFARRIKSLGENILSELQEATNDSNKNVQECAEIAIKFINIELLQNYSNARSKQSIETLISAYQILQQHEEQSEIKTVMDDFRKNAPSHFAMLMNMPSIGAEVKEILTIIGTEEAQNILQGDDTENTLSEGTGRNLNPHILPKTEKELAPFIKVLRSVVAGGERRQAAHRLGWLLDDKRLNDAADKMRIISPAEVDYLPFERLHKQESELWGILNQALDAKGYPPAITLEEAMKGIGKPSPEQIAQWYGSDAAIYISQKIGSGDPVVMGNSSILIKYINILGNVGEAYSINALEIMLGQNNEGVRRDAAKALGKIASPTSLQVLLQHSKTEKGAAPLREMASAFGNYDDPRIIPILTKLLETSRDSDTRKNAGASLVKLGHVDVVVQVMNTHSDKMFQSSAANGLAESGNASIVPHLLHALEHHPNFMVKLAVIKPLGELQEEAAFDPLTKVLETNNYSQKKAAVDALVHYGNRAIEALGGCVDDVNMPSWAVKRNLSTVSQKAKIGLETIGTSEALEMVSRWE